MTKKTSTKNKSQEIKKINLALQGGGAHGAYTWGIIDYLLEDGRFEFEAVTATSAGAMNAAALAQGLNDGGAEKAREVLNDFWSAVSHAGAWYSPVKRTPWEMGAALNPFHPDWSMNSSLYFSFYEMATTAFSPYQFNPANINPLREVIEDIIDFETIHKCKKLKIFVTATDVQRGTAKVFCNEDITADVLLASAALPQLFHAVKVEDRTYWDGGYMGNPSIWPLYSSTDTRDILLVHINPIVRDEIPREAYKIENRINEITFNSSLIKELRAIEFVKRLIQDDMLKDEYKSQYKDILLHAIRADDVLLDLSIASKFDTGWQFMTHLRDIGRNEAKKWVKKNFDAVGKRESVDIRKDYLEID